jgi:hypothetical protein
MLAEAGDGFVEQCLVAIPDADAATRAEDAVRDGETDALRPAGDDGNAPVQVVDIHGDDAPKTQITGTDFADFSSTLARRCPTANGAMIVVPRDCCQVKHLILLSNINPSSTRRKPIARH